MRWREHREVEQLFSARRDLCNRLAAIEAGRIDLYIAGQSVFSDMTEAEIFRLAGLAGDTVRRTLAAVDARLAALGVRVEGSEE